MAARNSPELAMAMETWKEIRFEYDTVDKLDLVHAESIASQQGGRGR